MNRTVQVLTAYRGLTNTVCRPDHLTHFGITSGMASLAAERADLSVRERAAWLFTAVAHALAQRGALHGDEHADYIAAARQWALDYDSVDCRAIELFAAN